MTEAEIGAVIDGFVQAARRCREAGFDGVEVWAAYQSLLEQFWTPWFNRRDDRWGGSLENRTRLSRSIIEGIRAECGGDFIIGLAVSHSAGNGVTLPLDELAAIVALHDATGDVDYVSVGSGGYLDFERLMPTFLFPETPTVDATAALKAAVRHARITAESHIRTPDNAEGVIASGSADLVSVVRGQIADPHWARKTAEGRAEDVRGCLSCNQMCWGRRSRDYWISCLINPSAGREFEWGGDRFTPAATPRHVLVVGAGPAGLEAARVAAERGHRVTLAEATNDLGGQFRLAGMQPRRAQILDLIDWYERQLARLQVRILRNSLLDAEDIPPLAPDVVILATGSLPDEDATQRWLPTEPSLPGLEKGGVWSPEDVMRRGARLGSTAIVYDEGGNWRGAGTAWHLAEAGQRVVLVTPDPFVGRELARTSADGALRQRLAHLGVRMVTEHVIARWGGDGATLRSLLDGREQHVAADALVMATTNRACEDISARLGGIEHHIIGDAAAPRQAPFAFFEGRRVGQSV